MINLITNYYHDKQNSRSEELFLCLEKNLENPLIDRVILIISSADLFSFPERFNTDKLHYITREDRPTYNYYFGITHLYMGDINIISNSDIYFNETLQQVINHYSNPAKKKDCMALSRWDLQRDGSIKHLDRRDSQDSWCFNGVAEIIDLANFGTGTCGCDNKIAYLLENQGYKIINPSKTIQAIHVHNTGIRNYKAIDDHKRIRPPFKLIQPTYL